MAKKQKNEISFCCEKCGKPQTPNKEESTGYFEVFDCHERCKCGGKFDMYLGEDKVG